MKIGDKVYLNSGSPELEVEAVSDNEAYVTVSWRTEATFPSTCLTEEVE